MRQRAEEIRQQIDTALLRSWRLIWLEVLENGSLSRESATKHARLEKSRHFDFTKRHGLDVSEILRLIDNRTEHDIRAALQRSHLTEMRILQRAGELL